MCEERANSIVSTLVQKAEESPAGDKKLAKRFANLTLGRPSTPSGSPGVSPFIGVPRPDSSHGEVPSMGGQQRVLVGGLGFRSDCACVGIRLWLAVPPLETHDNLATTAFTETAAPVGPSLSVLKLRVTPRGKHLNPADLSKASNTDIIHVLSDKKRKALESVQLRSDVASDDSSEDEGRRHPSHHEDAIAQLASITANKATASAMATQRSTAALSEIKAAAALSPSARRTVHKPKISHNSPGPSVPSSVSVSAVMNAKTQVVSRQQFKEISAAVSQKLGRGTKKKGFVGVNVDVPADCGGWCLTSSL
jgi:hypothetical protein